MQASHSAAWRALARVSAYQRGSAVVARGSSFRQLAEEVQNNTDGRKGGANLSECLHTTALQIIYT